MKSRAAFLSIAIGIVVLCSGALAAAEEFSADMIHTAGGQVMRGRIFVSNDKIRMETPDGVTISRMDKKLVWVLMPQDRMYMEQPFDPAKAAATSEKVDGELERTLVGQEMVDGKTAGKYRVVYEQNGRRVTLFQWLVEGAKIPVKTAAGDGSWTMEYQNIQTGAQPDSLFEVPADYQKFSAQMPSMDEMMKGLVE